MSQTWRVLRLVAGACSLSITGCNFLFSLDGYEGQKRAEDAGTAWCPNGAVFCDDFERSSDALQGDWASVGQNTGELTIVSGTPTGNALSSRLFAGDGGAAAYLATTAPLDGAKRVTMRSLVRLATPVGAGSVNINALTFVGATVRSLIFPIIQSPGLISVGEVVCAGGCNYAQTPPASFPADTWIDVSLTVDFSATPATYTLKLDGAIAVDAAASELGAQPGTFELRAGTETSQGHGEFNTSIDQLAITAE